MKQNNTDVRLAALMKAVALLLSAQVMPFAHADDGIGKGHDIAFRGFGTVGVACFSSETTIFTRDERPDGPGYRQTCDTRLDSQVGLQIDASLSKELEATLQATSYHRADGTYSPELTLANLRWLPSEDLAVRVGRMQNPLFMASEYRNVLYLQPWVRPPGEVYNLATTYLHDGIELTHYGHAGDWNFSLLGGLGRSKYDVPRGYETDATDKAEADFGYLGANLQQGNWLIKVGYAFGQASYSNPGIDSLLDTLHTAGQVFPALNHLADELALKDSRIDILSIGTRFEDDDWLLQAEYGYRHIDSFYRDGHGAYLMAGRHYGDWTPYGILSRRWTRDTGIRNTVPAMLAPLDAYVDALLASTNSDRSSFALGLSRKLGDQAILKFQIDWIKPDSDSTSAFGVPVPVYAVADRQTERLVTLNLDFAF